MDAPPSSSDLPHYDPLRPPPPQSAPGATPTWLGDTIYTMARRSISEEGRPLLPKISSITTSQKQVDVEMVRDEIEDHKGKLLKYEFTKMLKMSGPVIFAYMLQNSLQTGSVLVVGRLVGCSNLLN
jgi:hypothetical protein